MLFRILLIFCTFVISLQLSAQLTRTIDGSSNNLLNEDWGSAGAELGTITSNGFADGMNTPAGATRPNPRIISNTLFAQTELLNDPLNLSDFVWVFGQFLDHDVTAVSNSAVETANIAVDFADVHFNPGNAHDNVMIRMNRSMPRPNSGTSISNPRKFTNDITSWIDGSNVYGSDQERADYLRSFVGGKLKVSAGNLLPYNTITNEADGQTDSEAPHMENENPFNSLLFVAGDVRANEQPLLAGFHTLFVREHNRLCDELALVNPTWTDEELYQHARRKVAGYLQSITYNEWLPTIGVHLPPYQGYSHLIYPNATNVFSAAAFRLGHTLLNSNLQMMEDDGTYLGSVTLAEAFFNPAMITDGGMEHFFKGMAQQVEQNMDGKVVDDVRNFLFGPPQLGLGGLDLAAININRGRERGLSDFNTIRTDFGLAPYTEFSQICSDQEVVTILSGLYDSVNDIDPWVGMLIEDHMSDALFGETVMEIMIHQFQVLRDGDRFYYENDPGLSASEKNEIANTTFRDIMMRNTNLTFMQSNVFEAMPHDSICVASAGELPIFGDIHTFTGTPVEGVNIELSNSAEAVLETANSDQSGSYALGDNISCNSYFITPSFEGNNIREGLDSWDLYLMIRHILRIEDFDTAYKTIAADINRNGEVTIGDVIDLQRVLLYYENDFPNNTSWRFVDAGINFADPYNPFVNEIPDYSFVKLSEYNNENQFVALKVGDVSGNADPSNLQAGDTRADETLTFTVQDQDFVAGETYTIDFTTEEFKNLVGYQYTLNYDPAILKFVNVQMGALENLTDNNFVILEEEGAINTNWFSAAAITSDAAITPFSVTFQAKQNGALKDVLSINSRYTNAIAYQSNQTVLDVQLNFQIADQLIPATTLALYQNQPNPFTEETKIGFNLPAAMQATVEFYDVTGRQLFQVSQHFAKGYHEVPVGRADLNASGVIYYQLHTKQGSLTKKMVLN